ncbi:MAG: hypothetical protein AMJ90_00280 [candidate division Zixibacteria bacterium SM23_73_2]|nr:MAG: hypothetical protein AMJ90_00280 [candidate division Zixibacteria bacterium SM23_73_2]ODS39078.1 MAG: hypothetical protein A7315_11560 [Candidatus Altiarchaeales archaeon WOR_SM1_79]
MRKEVFGLSDFYSGIEKSNSLRKDREMRKRLFFLCGVAVLFFLFSSCAQQELTQGELQKLDQLRARSFEYVKELLVDYFQADAYGEESHYEQIVKKYKDIFDKENIQIVQKAMDLTTDPIEKKKLDYLRVYLVDGYVSQETAKYEDMMNKLNAEAVIFVGKDTIPYRQYGYVMSYEPDRNKREKISYARIPTIDKQKAIESERMAKTDSMLTEFGYENQAEFLEDYRLADFDQFAGVCQSFIKATDSLYFELFKEYAPKMTGVSVDDFRSWDFSLLWRGGMFDKYFPKEKLVSRMKGTLMGIGIDMDQQDALTLDTEERPKKQPRAACYPASIPHDVRINVKPIGGHDDYDAFFHEMGHAQHFLHSKEEGFEFNYLGNNTVTETYAFLFEYLIEDPIYLKEKFNFTGDDLNEFIRYRSFIRLLQTRSYCANFLFERLLYTDAPNLMEEYVNIRQPVLGFTFARIDSIRYLLGGDNFYSVDYLRAWFMEAQLKKMLKEKYGERWYDNPEAGEYLRTLWATGSRWTGQEMAEFIGVGRIDYAALKEDLEWKAGYGQ